MKFFKSKFQSEKPRIRIQRPAYLSQDEKTWREVKRYAELIPGEPDPNMGRVQEIKEEIKKGTYLTREMIEETAARLALRFTQRD